MLLRACGCCWRSGAAPRPCRGCAEDRRRWAVTWLRQWAGVQRFSSRGVRTMVAPCVLLLAILMLRRRRRQRRQAPVAVPPAAGPLESRRALHHRRPGRARLSLLVSRRAVARGAGQGVQRLSRHLSGRRHRADLAAVPDRDVVEGLRRPAVRNPADQRMAAHRPDAALHPRLRDSGGRPGRSRCRAIATRRSTSAPAARRKARTSIIRRSTWCRCGRSTRERLMRTLCARPFASTAPRYNAGLGFYAFLRFHVDSTKFRRWNMDPAVAAECPPMIHPEDIATVGQPLPAQRHRRRLRRRRCRDNPPSRPPQTPTHRKPSSTDNALCCLRATPYPRDRRGVMTMDFEKLTDRARGFLQAAQTIAVREHHQRIARRICSRRCSTMSRAWRPG